MWSEAGARAIVPTTWRTAVRANLLRETLHVQRVDSLQRADGTARVALPSERVKRRESEARCKPGGRARGWRGNVTVVLRAAGG
ncbi:hypothetical protein CA603_05770 [Paraburkholderia hospita]|nr:hypothetical protein CA603_05770 [Paraburkholderia hospita]